MGLDQLDHDHCCRLIYKVIILGSNQGYKYLENFLRG
jgi:hypothetical protein